MKQQDVGASILTDTAHCSVAAGQKFEETIAEIFGCACIPSMHTVSLRSAQITMTRTNAILLRREMTPRTAPEKAFVMSLPLKPFVGHELWKFGRLRTTDPYPQDSISMLHWEEDPWAVLPDRAISRACSARRRVSHPVHGAGDADIGQSPVASVCLPRPKHRGTVQDVEGPHDRKYSWSTRHAAAPMVTWT